MTEISFFALLALFSFAFGAVVSSFLNVVIWRVPRGESIVSPPSHCPKCNAAIKWYQNLPILSYLLLGGKCANCREPISPRYVFVETLGAILFFMAFSRVGLYVPLWAAVVRILVFWVWISLMIVGSFIDFDHKLLPDFVTVGGMVLGVAYALFLSIANVFSGAAVPFWSVKCAPLLISLSGLAFGFGLLWLIRFFGSKAFKREAMGLGDVFLMGAVGALFGPVAVLMTLILSSVFGSIAGLSLAALSKLRLGRFVEIPFGPYICLGCAVWMFYGPELVGWYLRLLK